MPYDNEGKTEEFNAILPYVHRQMYADTLVWFLSFPAHSLQDFRSNSLIIMSDPVILRSIKRLGEDKYALDLDDKSKNFILQSALNFIKHVK